MLCFKGLDFLILFIYNVVYVANHLKGLLKPLEFRIGGCGQLLWGDNNRLENAFPAFSADSWVLRDIWVMIKAFLGILICLDIWPVGIGFHLFLFAEKFIDVNALANYGFDNFEFVLEADFLVFDFLLNKYIIFREFLYNVDVFVFHFPLLDGLDWFGDFLVITIRLWQIKTGNLGFFRFGIAMSEQKKQYLVVSLFLNLMR